MYSVGINGSENVQEEKKRTRTHPAKPSLRLCLKFNIKRSRSNGASRALMDATPQVLPESKPESSGEWRERGGKTIARRPVGGSLRSSAIDGAALRLSTLFSRPQEAFCVLLSGLGVSTGMAHFCAATATEAGTPAAAESLGA